MNTRILTTVAIIAVTSATVISTAPDHAQAATVTSSYDAGYLDVLINGFGTDGLGTFRFDDGDGNPALALCIEADQPHTTGHDAYAPVASAVSSNHLDALIWLLERTPIDDDTAIAAAALGWYYAGAQRAPGVPVWSDGTNGFAPIGPLAPEPWDTLAPFSLAHPIGLRAGGIDLDPAERRVAELDRQVQAALGPWQLSAVDESHQFVLAGASGPIVGQPVTISISAPGIAPTTVQVDTDARGVVEVDLTGYDDGAAVEATVLAPGPHREWDGQGPVQRMVTATSIELASHLSVPPLPLHVHVIKHSTDPTIGVAGGVFALLDSTGTEVQQTISDAQGLAMLDPIDPSVHPGPYTITEILPPPALARTAPDALVHDASTDPLRPTTVEFTDDPVTVPLTVEKQLSLRGAGPADRSGFEFSVVRRGDRWATHGGTRFDGRTDPLELALGTYDICEIGFPDWAAGMVDGGCHTIEVGLDELASGEGITVPYLNIVPSPGIDTTAWDSADGDQTISATGGLAIDDVWLTDLTPGTDYTLTGHLLNIEPDGTTSIVQQVTVGFTAEYTLSVVPLSFEVPPLEATTLIITEHLSVGDEVVAVHDDLDDPDQTLTVEALPTTTSTTTTTAAPSTTLPTIVEVTTSTTPVSTTSPPRPTTPLPVITLPRTGNDDTARLLRIGDIGFVVGVALITTAGLLPRRRRSGAATT